MSFKWKDLFGLKLEKPNYHPYEKSALPNQYVKKFNLLNLKTVAGVTVNEITTRKDRIKQLVKKYEPVTESMEGAALHYTCRSTGTPFLQMRTISTAQQSRHRMHRCRSATSGTLVQ